MQLVSIGLFVKVNKQTQKSWLKVNGLKIQPNNVEEMLTSEQNMNLPSRCTMIKHFKDKKDHTLLLLILKLHKEKNLNTLEEHSLLEKPKRRLNKPHKLVTFQVSKSDKEMMMMAHLPAKKSLLDKVHLSGNSNAMLFQIFTEKK